MSRVVTQFALGYPEIGFSLTSGPRTLLQLACRCRKFEDRLFQVFGDRPDLVPVGKSLTGFGIKGFVAALAEQGPTRGAQNVFVNRRIVKDRTIAHAIIEAYSNASIKERSPEVHLFLEIPRRSRRRERASHEGRGAVSRPVVRSRSGEARGCRCHRQGRSCRSCNCCPTPIAIRCPIVAVDSGRPERRNLSEPVGGRTRCVWVRRCAGCVGASRIPTGTWNRHLEPEPGTRNRRIR